MFYDIEIVCSNIMQSPAYYFAVRSTGNPNLYYNNNNNNNNNNKILPFPNPM